MEKTAHSPSPFTLADRAILVTGASSGIGRAVAIAVSRLGGRVIGVGRNVPRLEETLTMMEGPGHQMRATDLQDLDALPSLLEDVEASLGPLSGIVHAAGTLRPKALRMLNYHDLEAVMRLHLHCAAGLLTYIAQRGVPATAGCSVVLMGSILSTLGAPGLTAYATAKAALVGLTRTGALELAPKNVRVNAILAGYVETPMTHALGQMLGHAHLSKMAARHPLGLGRPEDVANAATFLLADASRWMTGACMSVDGGYSAE